MAESEPLAADELRIRMYRGILGDCFLVAHRVGGNIKHMLIDCGALQNVRDQGGELDDKVAESLGPTRALIKDSDARIAVIAKDVSATVQKSGGRIDRLVVTHEHYDHVSGFAVAKTVFEDPALRIAELWLAWTENPADARAREIQARMNEAKQALALARRVSALAGAEEELADALSLTAFLGPLHVPGESAADRKMTTRETLTFLKEQADAVRFLEPGMVLEPDQGIGLKTYVLGPPRSERLTKSAPSGGSKKEVYLTGPDETVAVDRTARRRLLEATANGGGFALSPEDKAQWRRDLASDAMPFTRPHWRRYRSKARSHDPQLRQQAPASPPDEAKDQRQTSPPSDNLLEIMRRYEDASESYRLIDEGLNASVGSLALKMDSHTNNTSLALAFELPGGDVLLFPGDAQVGNWLSWADQHYPASKPAEEAVRIEDILRRVVFYKVGHHASHNATLKQGGLGMMSSPKLSAAIPVVESVAKIQGRGRKTPGRGWKMPYKELYDELQSRTRGRIVRGDGDRVAERAAFARAPTDAGAPVTLDYDDGPDDLWVELVYRLG